ncbi:uncharacterized protein [Struthio camelus]|uniref:uncharacterized protein isoform X2 n=1 Tax=Struthio camelus TaxID=8801 RepID=UPI003603F8B1
MLLAFLPHQTKWIIPLPRVPFFGFTSEACSSMLRLGLPRAQINETNMVLIPSFDGPIQINVLAQDGALGQHIMLLFWMWS